MDQLFTIAFVFFIIWSIVSTTAQSKKGKKNMEAKRAQGAAQTANLPRRPHALQGRQTRPHKTPASHENMTQLEKEGYFAGAGGSLEGVDPCHDDYEAYAPYQPATARNERQEEQRQGNPLEDILNLSKQGLVQGVIFSEVLARKPVRRQLR